jgi:hypothetical protein
MKCVYLGWLLLAQLACHGQYYFSANNKPEPEWMWELGLSAGAMNCLTDLGGGKGNGKKFIKDINWNQSLLCAGVFLSSTWQSAIAIRLQLTAGQLKANDDVLAQEQGPAYNRFVRNLHFKTVVAELTVSGELHPLPLLSGSGNLPLLSPYLIGGIGFFHYNPQAWYNNRWVDLPPLHTEGQGFAEYPDRIPYKKISWALPLGGGIKYDAGHQLNARLELLYRITGTDYLDDVSSRYIDPSLFSRYLSAAEAAMAAKLADRSAGSAGAGTNKKDDVRGNPANRDAYFSLTLSISIALGRIQRK